MTQPEQRRVSASRDRKSSGHVQKKGRIGVYMTPMTTLKKGLYTPDEDNVLREYYAHKGITWCGNQLNRATHSVARRAKRLRLRMTRECRWQVKSDSYRKPDDWYAVNPGQFRVVESPDVAYLLGFLWADGYVKIAERRGGGNYVLALVFSECDYQALKRVFDRVGRWAVYPMKMTSRHRTPTVNIRTGNKPLVELLVDLDYHIKSKVAPIKILSHIPEHLHHYWWRGYFDGDGSFTSVKRSYSFSFTGAYEYDWTAHLALLDGLGVRCSLRHYRRKSGSYSGVYCQNIEGTSRFAEYIYQGYETDLIGLPRKWTKWQIIKSARLIS